MTQTKYTPNPDIKFGRVVGKIIEIVPDGSDDGNIPDFYGAEGSIVFRPVNPKTLVTSDALFVTTPQSINVRPEDVDNPGTLNTTYKSVIGFEDSSAEIRFSRCRFRHTTKESRGVIALTTVSSRNPDGG